jgi:site-specific DNA-methyltransferase (adenine-specific)
MDGMKEFPDKYFELAIVDPPYGIGASRGGNGSRRKMYDRSNLNAWDDAPPKPEYWEELFRVSVNQIIFGMNYFQIPPCKHFIVWDKKQPDGVSFAQAELLWTSFIGTSKIIQLRSVGQKDRFHPTQKPIEIYMELLRRYAKQGDKILDTHVGSASSLIACHELGFDYVGFELDKDYFDKATERLELVKAQMNIFDFVED